jgi:uncharacterized protein with PQ loop repeat
MNKEKSKKIFLIISLGFGILIFLAPSIITGRFYYDEVHVMGPLLVSEFLMRTASLILGLIIIYDGIKNFFK